MFNLSYKVSKEIFGKRWGKLIYLLLLVTHIASFWLGSKSNEVNIINNVEYSSVPVLSAETEETTTGTALIEGDTVSFSNDWNIGNYNVRKDGYICANTLSAYLTPAIWLNSTIPTNFRQIEFSYFPLPNKQINAPLILFIGDNLQILKLYIQENEKNPQLIGNEKINIDDPNFKLKRNDPLIISDPPKMGAKIDLVLRSKVVKANEMEFTLNIIYISEITSGPKEDSYDLNVVLPDPNIANENSKIKFGIATFRGKCIKPTSYKIGDN